MIETAYLEIAGMHCVNCPIKVEKAISKLDGVVEIDVSWENEMGCVTFDRDRVSISDMIDRIHKMGFEVKEVQHH